MKIKQMPIPVAVIIMVVCILAGVAFGNNNALARATKEPEAMLSEVSALASQRAAAAKNLLVVANRNEVADKDRSALQGAIEALEDARRANAIASANQGLTFAAGAVNDQLQQVADGQDRKLATGVMDNLGSFDKQITRQANLYNESLGDARALYNKLPMRFVLGGVPEVYQ